MDHPGKQIFVSPFIKNCGINTDIEVHDLQLIVLLFGIVRVAEKRNRAINKLRKVSDILPAHILCLFSW